jgi:hypothetical protein
MSVCFSCLTSKDTFFGESHNIDNVTVSDIIECLSIFLDGRECEEEEKAPCENARKVRAKVVYYSNLALYNLTKYPQGELLAFDQPQPSPSPLINPNRNPHPQTLTLDHQP